MENKPMTVGELIEKLQEYDKDMFVFYPCETWFHAAHFTSYEIMGEPDGIKYHAYLSGKNEGIVIV